MTQRERDEIDVAESMLAAAKQAGRISDYSIDRERRLVRVRLIAAVDHVEINAEVTL